MPLEHAVVRAVDARHASGADELLELVPVRDTSPTIKVVTSPGPSAEARFERLFPDAERLLELGVGDHERDEHADAVAVDARR